MQRWCGGGVEVKIFLGKAVVFHDHGVFAAGLDFQFDTSLFKRRRIRFQLIVRNVCRRALADEAEAFLVDNRQTPSKVTFLSAPQKRNEFEPI